jgi:chromosome segregation protein
MLRLTQIELLGFKSFPHKTVLDLSSGVNCIVGPNGSGKSNVADAIMFAFGTQSSRELRTSNLAGLIFAGTQQLKPLNMASVTLHFARSDEPLHESDLALAELEEELEGYEEQTNAAAGLAAEIEARHSGIKLTRHHPAGQARVYDPTPAVMKQLAELQPGDRISLTRRVFRDGTGSYFINGEPVRLKDVDAFFDRYHLGRSAVFSVTQGEVERKILASAQEMREWLAEATGVSMLLTQKDRAQVRLKRTEANLERLNDIRTHTSTLVAELAEQRGRAEEYLRLSRELKDVELNEIRREVEFHQNQLQSAGASLAEVRAELERATLQLNTLRERESTSTARRRELEQQIEQAQRSQEDLRSHAELLRREAAVSRANAQSSGEAIEQAKLDDAELAALIETLTEELTESDHSQNEARARVGELQGSEDAARQKFAEARGRIESLQQQQAGLAQRVIDLAQTSARAANELEAVSRQRDQVAGQLDSGARYLDAARERMAQLDAELARESDKAESLQGRVHELTAKRDQQLAAMVQLGSELLAAEDSIAGLRGRTAELNARRQSLAEIEAHARETGSGHLLDDPALSSRLRRATDVTFPTELRAAFARVLAQHSESLIGGKDVRSAVLSAVEKADAVLLTDATPRELHWRSLWHQLEADVDVRASLVNAIGDVALVDSLADAEALLANEPGMGVVLRDGSAYLRREVSVLGVPSPERAREVSRRTDLGEVEGQLAELQAEFGKAEEQQAQLKARQSQLQWERDEAAAALAGAEAQQLSAKELLHRLEENVAQRRDELTLLEGQRSELSAQHAQLHDDLPQLEAHAQQIAVERAQLENERAALERQLTEAQQELDALRTAAAEAATQLKLAEQQHAHQQQLGFDIAERLSNARIRHESLARRVDQLQSEVQAAGKRAEEDEVRAAELDAQLAASAGQLSELHAKRVALASEMEGGAAELQQLSHAASRLEQDSINLEGQIERAGERIQEWLADLKERFHMTMSQLLSNPSVGAAASRPSSDRLSQGIDLSEAGRGKLREEKTRLRTALEELGAVNLLSIEQHSQQSAKLQFLTRQTEDLARAVADLTALVGSLDSRTEQQYRDSLSRIEQSFNAMFLRLFGEGWARLRFEDPGSIIDSGVEVEVQIPGGRRHNLRSLSGGQRSLIFLALFFAVHSVRSPGFCILDEADAALDDANVGRFAELIEGFTEVHEGHIGEQFIVVTHNKRTMETADKLIGVTSRPKGVSNLLEVDLKDARRLVDRPVA